MAFVLVAAAVGLGWTEGLDETVRSFAAEQRSPGLTSFMTAISAGFAPGAAAVLTIVVAVAAAVWTRNWRAPLVFAGGVLAAALTFRLVKELLRRPRADAGGWLEYAGGWSFPSGHTTTATAVCLGFVAVFASAWPAVWRRLAWVVAALLAVVVGLSRIYLGVHWFTDVVGGLCLGIAASAVMGGVASRVGSASARGAPSAQR